MTKEKVLELLPKEYEYTWSLQSEWVKLTILHQSSFYHLMDKNDVIKFWESRGFEKTDSYKTKRKGRVIISNIDPFGEELWYD